MNWQTVRWLCTLNESKKNGNCQFFIDNFHFLSLYFLFKQFVWLPLNGSREALGSQTVAEAASTGYLDFARTSEPQLNLKAPEYSLIWKFSAFDERGFAFLSRKS